MPARKGVIPKEALEAPTPSEEEFRRGYALRAVQGRGALTAGQQTMSAGATVMTYLRP